jgi:hypothetical protein
VNNSPKYINNRKNRSVCPKKGQVVEPSQMKLRSKADGNLAGEYSAKELGNDAGGGGSGQFALARFDGPRRAEGLVG